MKKELTTFQKKIVSGGTEPAFNNDYWNEKRAGIYVDIQSGEPLFISIHKYDSGTGWPSFYKKLPDTSIIKIKDSSFGMIRTEVKTKKGNTHLGHYFKNDKKSPNGDRYCINSASLTFIVKGDLKKNGYQKYLKYFNI